MAAFAFDLVVIRRSLEQEESEEEEDKGLLLAGLFACMGEKDE